MIMNMQIPECAFSRRQDKNLVTEAEWGSVDLAMLWTWTLYFCGAHTGLIIIINDNNNNNSNEAEEKEKKEKVKV